VPSPTQPSPESWPIFIVLGSSGGVGRSRKVAAQLVPILHADRNAALSPRSVHLEPLAEHRSVVGFQPVIAVRTVVKERTTTNGCGAGPSSGPIEKRRRPPTPSGSSANWRHGSLEGGTYGPETQLVIIIGGKKPPAGEGPAGASLPRSVQDAIGQSVGSR